MGADYAWEKLYLAVRGLASGTSTLHKRLRDAYVFGLIQLRPEEDFPWEDLRARFEAMRAEIAPEGYLETGLADWPDIELQRIVEEIVDLHNAVTARRAESRP